MHRPKRSKIWICEDAYLLKEGSQESSVFTEWKLADFCLVQFKEMSYMLKLFQGDDDSKISSYKLIITDLWSKDTHDDIQISLSNLYFPPFFQDQNKNKNLEFLPAIISILEKCARSHLM